MKLSELLWRSDLKEKFVLQKFLCHFLACSREQLWMDTDKEISDESIQKILTAYKSYVEDKKPIEYVLWHVDFFGNEFIVNEATLIPRPETEYMITAVTEYIQQIQDTRYKIQDISSDDISWVMYHASNLLLDIWTGCWVLWISVLLQNAGYFDTAILTDYFENALAVAKKNFEVYKGGILAANSNLNVEFFQSDLLDFLTSSTLNELKEDKNIVLVANLPYIPEEAFEQNSWDNVKKWEPKPAFVGGDDGLIYYRKMFEQLFQLTEQWIVHSDHWFVMFLEMMTWQVDILRQEFGDRMEFEEVKTFHFNIRIVKAWLK